VLALAFGSLPALAHPPADEALADLAARIAADPSDPYPYLERAALLGERGDAAAALADCAAASDSFQPEDPDRPLVNLVAGQALLADGRVSDALPRLDAFLSARPRPALVARARALTLLDRSDEAIAGYRRALDAAPTAGPELHLELARALRAAGRPHEALAALLEALRRLGPIPALQAAALDLAASLGVPAPAPAPQPAAGASSPAAPDRSPAPLPSHPGAPVVVRGPYLQLATPSSIVVRWETDVPSHRLVRFGPAGGTLDDLAGDGTIAVDHEVALTGLAPESRYAYAVEGASDPPGAEPTFGTPPAPGADRPVRVWVVGDSGTANADARAVRDAYRAFAAADRPADLWLMLGDNAYTSGTEAQYQAAVFDTYPDELASLPLWPALGNHDALSADSETGTGPYYDLFSLPRAAEAGGVPSGTEAYYSFDHGPVHFVCLDSQGSDRSAGGAMLAWLAADLAATRAPWIVAYWHHPPYTKGSHDSDREPQLAEMRERFLPVLEAHGVDLVLTGHSHSYERSFLLDGHYGPSDTLAPGMVVDGGDGRPEGGGAYEKPSVGGPHEGAVYAVAGSSGRVGGGTLDHPAMAVSLRELGSLVLDVEGRELRAAFLQADGTVADRFTILQGPPPPPADLLVDPDFPGYRFGVVITGAPGDLRPGVPEADCPPESLCASGAVPGRTEVLLRLVGPKPNGYLWPTIVKLTTSQVEVWIEQVATGQLRYYRLAGARPGEDTLPGLFDRRGFLPEP
jgi:tetratricopeptide (TPR) repeat protein